MNHSTSFNSGAMFVFMFFGVFLGFCFGFSFSRWQTHRVYWEELVKRGHVIKTESSDGTVYMWKEDVK